MDNTSKVSNYFEADFGLAQPSPSSIDEKIYVVVDPTSLILDFGRAFAREVERVAEHNLAERIGLTEDEMASYCLFLVKQRVDSINDKCTIWRQLKQLYIPAFVQSCLSVVGEVHFRDWGTTIVPIMEDCEVITFEEAFAISNKISYFQQYVQVVQDAMPRDKAGDPNVMATALIAGEVRSLRGVRVKHPSYTLATVFLGLKLKEEVTYANQYRETMDTPEFIRSVIMNNRLF